MTWAKGQTGNPQGRGSKGSIVVEKIRKSADKMIDKIGFVAFTDILVEQFKAKPLETLKALSVWMPKDVTITSRKDSATYSDEELRDIIATNARNRRQALDKPEVIEGESRDITEVG